MKKFIFLFVFVFMATCGFLSAQNRDCKPATNLNVTYSPTCGRADLSWDAPAAKSTSIINNETPRAATGMVSVTLEAHDLWSDGTGYQMLLDATHTLYGSGIPSSGVAIYSSCAPPETLYDQFSHKIPNNADPSCTTTNIVFDGAVTIQIPAGVYDWCIVNPTPGDRLYIAGSDASVPAENKGRRNDYVFQEGYKYRFSMERIGTQGAEYSDCVIITVEEEGDCDPVSNLNAVVTGSVVALSWTPPQGNPTSYQVIRDGAILANTTSTSYTDNNAPEGINNYCVTAIYSNCFKSACKMVNVGDKCALKFDLHSTYSTGWSGASIGIKVNGTSYGTVTLSSGSNTQKIVTIPSGALQLTWNKGSWDNECYFEVYDKEDIIIYSVSSPSALLFTSGQVIFTDNYECSKLRERYNIYRDGIQIASNVVTTSYSDIGFNSNVAHVWSVAVVCDAGESERIDAGKCVCSEGSSSDCDNLFFGPATGNVNSMPFSAAYNYGYSQQLFHASELTYIPVNAKITSISYSWVYNQITTYSNVTIWIGNTTKSIFTGDATTSNDWVPTAQMQKVFQGSITLNNTETWTQINFDTPFDYMGGNIVVAVMNNTGVTYIGSTVGNIWGILSSGLGNVTLFYRNNTGPINPNSLPTVTYSSGTANTGSFSSSRNAAKFDFCASYVTHEVGVSVNIPGAGTVSGSGTYKKDDCVAVYARPAANSTFKNWTENGIVISTNQLYTFTVSHDVNLVANFEVVQSTYQITFKTVNITSDEVIEGVDITVDGKSQTTDVDGTTIFELKNGVYPYSAVKDGYLSASGSATVSSAAALVTVKMQALGVEKLEKTATFTLYPNPADDRLTMLCATAGKMQMELYNSIGMRILSLDIDEIETQINLSTLASGVYIVRLFDGQTSSIQRFIKK